ncbi:stomatin-like protein 2, mitochondrial [Phymastichus coffea]|uniref:stomatin-like protein 2, mitochondrial n=1 Tax=Phymastichus coffea TaxID=108790 RepID=UPI00273B90ED|nr:stomatin-like protein 2, mitochondrial [Phymastichus coffea]XP_058808838.1 stomatin-like protein 2, mitochondrial [Phymastichus coffea]XP_058808839.1 stomatin-like protein 2, mitochondrial [Phymastichus coffea]
MLSKTRLLRNVGALKNCLSANIEFGNAGTFLAPIQVREKASTPINTVVMFVPQQEAWVVERMGKYHRILEPGLNLLIPVIDTVKYVQSLKEIAIDVPKQSAITSDNVTLSIDGVLYLKVNDPFLASYGVEDPEFAIIQLAQTTMRSELGKISLDKVFQEREGLNISIVESINKASAAWGIACLRYEIRDIRLPERVHEAMQMQVEAERKKRAAILESEGIREADINIAEGKRQAKILASEAEKQEFINKANGEAEAMLAVASARAKGLKIIAASLDDRHGKNAAALTVAEKYIGAFDNLAKTNNTLIIPKNVGDVSSFVGQAMAIYKHVATDQWSTPSPQAPMNIDKQQPVPHEIKASDDSYEYFSDKDEAESHKEKARSKQSPQTT